MSKQIKIFMCMKNRLIRESIAHLLRSENYDVRLSAECVEDLVNTKMKIEYYSIVIFGGFEKNRYLIEEESLLKIRVAFPSSKIVVLVENYQSEQRWHAERLGVAGVLLHSISKEVFTASLSLIALGEQVFSIPAPVDPNGAISIGCPERHIGQIVIMPDLEEPERPCHRMASRPILIGEEEPKLARRGELSERELEILSCLVAGNSNKAIARLCNITEATVKVHLKAILRKTAVANRTQAAVWALNNVDLNGRMADGQMLSTG